MITRTLKSVIMIIEILLLKLYFLLDTITLQLSVFLKWRGDKVITLGAIRERG